MEKVPNKLKKEKEKKKKKTLLALEDQIIESYLSPTGPRLLVPRDSQSLPGVSLSVNPARIVSMGSGLGGTDEQMCLGFALPCPESLQAAHLASPRPRSPGCGTAGTQPASRFSGCRAAWPTHTGSALVFLAKEAPRWKGRWREAKHEHFPGPSAQE